MNSLSTLLLASALVAVGGLSARAAGRRRAASSRGAVSKSRVPARNKTPDPGAVALASTLPTSSKPPLAAPWMHPLKKALNHGGTQRRRDRSEAKRKHVQLATVDPRSGRPSVRTVVFRGFLPRKLVDSTASNGAESCCLMFITDDRSAKYAHLGGGSSSSGPSRPAPIECCWWLDEAGVQFRISGHAVLASARSEDPLLRAAATSMWERLGASSRRTFFWPAPGEPLTAGTAAASAGDDADDLPLEEAHFCLLLVVPEVVDELHLGGKQKRIVYTADDEAAQQQQQQREGGGGGGGGATPLRLPTRWEETAVNP